MIELDDLKTREAPSWSVLARNAKKCLVSPHRVPIAVPFRGKSESRGEDHVLPRLHYLPQCGTIQQVPVSLISGLHVAPSLLHTYTHVDIPPLKDNIRTNVLRLVPCILQRSRNSGETLSTVRHD